MSTEPTLRKVEKRLLSTLRHLPPGAVRDAFVALVDELACFALEPRCAEMQADGVPCATATGQCQTCREAAQVLQRLRTQVPH